MISKNALQNVLADTTQCAGFSIRRASRAVAQLYDRTLAPSGLKGTQFSLLSAIALTGNKSINQLAQLMLMDRTTLTRNLRPLQNQKLVQIKANSNDQRSKILQITAKGANKLQQALPL